MNSASNALAATTGTTDLFDQHAWRDLCEAASTAAARSCGLSDTVYTAQYSAAIDAALLNVPADAQALALSIAKECGDYASAEAIAQGRIDLLANGWCAHGIDPNACPAGCGDLASAHPDAANEILGDEVDEIAACWSFLQSKQFALEARGFEALAREFPAAPGRHRRISLSWIPGVEPAFARRISRQYTLEVTFPEGQRPLAYFAGCGIVSERTARRAGADLEISLQTWYEDFKVLSRQQHELIFG